MTYCPYCRQPRHPDPIPLYTLLVLLIAVLAWALVYVRSLAEECAADPAAAAEHLRWPGPLHPFSSVTGAHRMPRIHDAYRSPQPPGRP